MRIEQEGMKCLWWVELELESESCMAPQADKGGRVLNHRSRIYKGTGA